MKDRSLLQYIATKESIHSSESPEYVDPFVMHQFCGLHELIIIITFAAIIYIP